MCSLLAAGALAASGTARADEPAAAPDSGSYSKDDPDAAKEADMKARRKDLSRALLETSSLPESADYQGARSQKIGGIVAMGLGGATFFGGTYLLIWASLRHWDLFKGAEPDRPAQAVGGALMAIGAASLIGGGIAFKIGKNEQERIENKYLARVPDLRVGVGVGSVFLSGTF